MEDTRKHIVYELRIGSENYVGVTAKTAKTIARSLHDRVSKHWYRAQKETKQWLLCEALRSLESREEIDVRVLAVVEGKSQGHQREVELRRQIQPTLNTDRRGD